MEKSGKAPATGKIVKLYVWCVILWVAMGSFGALTDCGEHNVYSNRGAAKHAA